MKRSLRSPYFWTIVAMVGVVSFAWVQRENYQPLIPGAVAPEFSYPVYGDDVAMGLTDLEDKVVLLNVWATWCGPCVEEMPSMQRLYDHFGAESDFEIVAVSIDVAEGEFDLMGRPGGDLGAFAERFDLTFPILQNQTGDIQQTYQTTGVPESFLIGRDGVIARRVAGQTAWDSPENVEHIQRLLER